MIRKTITLLLYVALIAGVTFGLLSAVRDLGPGQARAAVGNIDSTHKWAWGTNVGWINFAPSHGGVTVYADHLEGYAWSENVGWIRLGTHTGGGEHTYANTSANTYGVNYDGTSQLSGYAWSSNAGWIDFNPAHGGVTLDPATGSFDGYAWGENVGWISFKGTGAVAYNVVTDWGPASRHFVPIILK
jgi:hypothetical protein